MKIDRLIGITMYLLNRDMISARELAERFEVSVRTIVRDMESLSKAGIPVFSSTGAKGGYSILDTFKLNKSIANVDDYLNIVTAVKGMCSAYENKKLDMTLEKLLAVNTGNEQHSVILDFNAARENDRVNESLPVIEQAITAKRRLEFDYTDSVNHGSHRITEPLLLTYKWYAWYVFAYCTEKKAYRLFKAARISNPMIAKQSFFHLHHNSSELLEAHLNKDRRTYWNIKLLCRAEVKTPVNEYLGGTVVEEYENGDFVILLHLPENERMWFSLLLGFGSKIKVLEPQELKNRLLQNACDLQSLYQE